MSKLGNLIREKRREYKFTQAELAEKVGVTHGYIAKIEIGYQKCGIKTLSKLADTLSVSFLDMLDVAEYHSPLYKAITESAYDYDEQFSKLSLKLKMILLEIAPILEKYL